MSCQPCLCAVLARLMRRMKGNHKGCPYGWLVGDGLGGFEFGEGDVVGYILEYDF